MICPRCSADTRENQRFCGQCGAALSPIPEELPWEVGQVLDGRYRLSYLIGQGGMGSVYRSEVVGLGHTVAVKILHPALAADPVSRRRLENEARLASQINHPNIVAILDYHTSPALTYLVMEYLRGESLREVLHQVGYLGVQRAIHITRQLLSALEASHTLGVLHRDLKPDNVYLITRQDNFDFVKVLDFGMAVLSQAPEDTRLTSTGQVCGTPAYMSPEQARGRELTEQSDLYSVGVILYECLTGFNPFLGANTADTLVNHLTRMPELPSIACKAAQIPPYLDAVAMRAMRKIATERFESAAEFRKVLEALVLARRRDTRDDNRGITTCPECGKPLIVGAKRCEACKHLLQKPSLGPEAIKEIVPPEMVQALEDTGMRHLDIQLSPTVTSTTCPAIGWDPPLVGLQRELGEVKAMLAPQSGVLQVLRIVGQAGLGKGRLAREAVRLAQQQGVQVIWTETEFLSVYAPLYPIQGATARLLRLPEPVLDEGDLVSAAEAAGFDMVHQQGLTEIFGFGTPVRDPADARRARRADAWRAVVRCAARRNPVLLVFPDLQHLDAPSRELVAALAANDPTDHPVHVLVTEEPGLFMLWPETKTINLSPLSSKDAVALVASLLQRSAARVEPEPIAEASGGNPLLLIELVRLVGLDPMARLPHSLAEAITQRISQLPPRARMLLHAMAVLGRPSSPDTLVTMVSEKVQETATLNLLAEQGFLVAGDKGWRPAHRVYREVAYASIPIAVRSILHLQAARLAIDQGMPTASIAHHLFEGGNHAAAVPYMLRAGMRALDLLDDALAVEYFNRVLKIIPPPPRKFDDSSKAWLTANLGLAVALHDGGDLVSAQNTLRRAAQAAGEVGWVEEQRRCERRIERLHRQAGAATTYQADASTVDIIVSWEPGGPKKV